MLRLFKIFILQLSFIWLFFLPMQSFAENIDFKDFKLTGSASNFKVNTRVEFELTEYLRNALQNGISLNARIQFRLGKHNSWWFNDDTPLLTVTYQLKYHALSRHYLLSRNDTNQHWNFSNLPSAIRKLSELRKYSLPDITKSLEDGEYYILAAADMAPSSLGLPLRFQSLFSDQYKLTSEGVLWPLP
ncbi:MAG: hypothetical protein ACI88H_000524 [Cocleimonas sp.]|jgi:hypothetical protein